MPASVQGLCKMEWNAGTLIQPCFSLCLQPTHSVDYWHPCELGLGKLTADGGCFILWQQLRLTVT